MRCGGRGSAQFRAAGGARGFLAQSGRSRSDPGEIPPAWSQPAAGARPGHCSPRRRSALASCRERAVPTRSQRPLPGPAPTAHSVPSTEFLSSADRPPWALCSGECLLHKGMHGHPRTDLSSCRPIGCRCRALSRLPREVGGASGEGRQLPRSLEPFSLDNA